VADGTWLNEATARYPAAVLGAVTADRLGLSGAGIDLQVYVGGQWFTVIGILSAATLAPELDSAVLVGWPAAQTYLGFNGHPTTVYARSDDSQVGATRGDIRTQFLAEARLLSALGGAGGVGIGVLVTAGYAITQRWPIVVPAWASAGGVAATVVIRAVAGLYPALRAARMAPTEALATT
jgi:hypothetical protein